MCVLGGSGGVGKGAVVRGWGEEEVRVRSGMCGVDSLNCSAKSKPDGELPGRITDVRTSMAPFITRSHTTSDTDAPA